MVSRLLNHLIFANPDNDVAPSASNTMEQLGYQRIINLPKCYLNRQESRLGPPPNAGQPVRAALSAMTVEQVLDAMSIRSQRLWAALLPCSTLSDVDEPHIGVSNRTLFYRPMRPPADAIASL